MATESTLPHADTDREEYRCVTCGGTAPSAESLAGHYRVTKHGSGFYRHLPDCSRGQTEVPQ